MRHTLRPLIHKAPVLGLRVHVGRTGLCIGDPAALELLADGHIGIFALVRRRLLGLALRRSLLQIGHLGPTGATLLRPALERGQHLRVRIVGLTPEHLAAPEVHISVWGDATGLGVQACGS